MGISQQAVTIVIPTYNENNVDFKELLIKLSHLRYKVIVSDDGHDGLQHICNHFPNVTYTPGGGDEASSIHRGLLLVNTPYSVIMDADGSHDYSAIEEFCRFADSNTIINGSRYLISGTTNAKKLNRFISKTGNWLISKLLRKDLTDWTGRFLLAPTNLLLTYQVWHGGGDAGFAFLNNALQDGYTIKEVGFNFKLPKHKANGTTNGYTGLIKYGIRCTLRLVNLKLNRNGIFSAYLIQQGLQKNYSSEKPLHVGLKALLIESLSIIPLWVMTKLMVLPIPFMGLIIQNYPQSILGYVLRACWLKSRTKHFGTDVLIGPNVILWNPNNISIHSSTRIDNNVTILAIGELVLKQRVSIHQNSLINSKGSIYIDHDSCIGSFCAIYGATNRYQDEHGNLKSHSYASPWYDQEVEIRGLRIGHHSYLGTHSTLIATDIGDYITIGANSFIYKRPISDYQIWAGTPATWIRDLNGNRIQQSREIPSEPIKTIYSSSNH